MQPVLVFDADDTLWDEQGVLQKFEADLEARLDRLTGRSSGFRQRFIAVEDNNIAVLGYGLASYVYSVAEAVGSVPGWRRHKAEILALVGDLIANLQKFAPRPIDEVYPTLSCLSQGGYRLALLTRGIEFEQQAKLARSGLAAFFSAVRVVERKDISVYRELAGAFGDHTGSAFCMIGNSMRGDVLPALEAGWRAIHVPAPTAWAHDHAPETTSARFRRAESFKQVAELVQSAGFWG